MTGWTDEERKAIHNAARFSDAMDREEAVEEAIDEAERILAVRLAAARKEARPEIAGEGVYDKYRVERTDGRDKPGGDKANARYFVLDYVNDEHAMKALRAYVDSVWEDNPLAAGKLVAYLAEQQGVTLPDQSGRES